MLEYTSLMVCGARKVHVLLRIPHPKCTRALRRRGSVRNQSLVRHVSLVQEYFVQPKILIFYDLYKMWRLLCLVFAAHSPCQRFLTMCHRSASHRIDTLLLVSIKSSTVQSARHTARIDVLDALSICAPKEMNLRAEGLLVYSCRVRIIVLANTSTDASTTTVGGTIQRHPTTNIASVRSSSWHSVIIGILLHSMAVQGVIGVSAIWYLMVTACWTKGPIVNDRMSKSDAPVAMCLRWSQYVTWIF